VNLKVEDYYPSGKRFLLRFKEKGGKEKELPVHHKLEEILDQYLKATGLGTDPEILSKGFECTNVVLDRLLHRSWKLSYRHLLLIFAPLFVFGPSDSCGQQLR
jgi:hypothetical protein